MLCVIYFDLKLIFLLKLLISFPITSDGVFRILNTSLLAPEDRNSSVDLKQLCVPAHIPMTQRRGPIERSFVLLLTQICYRLIFSFSLNLLDEDHLYCDINRYN